MRCRNFLLSFLFFSVSLTQAQYITFPANKNITIDDLYPIMLNDQLEGYYALSPAERSGRFRRYNLDVMDYRFQFTQELKFTFPDSGKIIESNFNGTHFLLACYYNTTKVLRMKILDLHGKSTWDTTIYQILIKSAYAKDPIVFYSIPRQGFLLTGMPQTDFEISICMNNSGKILWSILPEEIMKSNGKPDGYEVLVPFAVNNDYLCMILNRDQISKDDYKVNSKYWLRFYDMANGKEIFEVNSFYSQGYMVPKQVLFHRSSITVLGAYFPGQNPIPMYLDEKGQGIYFQQYDYSGKLIHEKIEPWSEQVYPYFNAHQIPELTESEFTWIHQVTQLKNGNYYFTGEIFSTKPEAGAISNFGGATTRKMFVLRYNTDFVLEDAKLFTRAPSGVLSRDKTYSKFIPTGHYLSWEHHTDYRYTLMSKDSTYFISLFNTFEHPPKEPVKFLIEAVGVNRDGEIFNSTITIDGIPDSFMLLPSKIGYATMVRNYYFSSTYSLSFLNIFKFDF